MTGLVFIAYTTWLVWFWYGIVLVLSEQQYGFSVVKGEHISRTVFVHYVIL